MKIKKYVVNDMKEAMTCIRSELGENAVIINTQHVSEPGVLGAFKKKKLEVIAALEDQYVEHEKITSFQVQKAPAQKQHTKLASDDFVNSMRLNPSDFENMIRQVEEEAGFTKGILARPYSKDEALEKRIYSPEQERLEKEMARVAEQRRIEEERILLAEQKRIEKERLKAKQAEKNKYEAQQPYLDQYSQSTQIEEKGTSQSNQKDQLVMDELQSLKQMVQQLYTTNSMPKSQESPNLLPVMNEVLEDYDFSKDFKKSWLAYLTDESYTEQEVNENALYQFVESEATRIVKLNEDVEKKIQVFVGPPGVGKTTTIAKIASNEILYNQKKVGMITVDTYRIGAVEQLKTYASILNIPIKVVYSQLEMQAAIKELQSCDCIIIDSVGRTHRDEGNLTELKKLFEVIEDYSCYLVLSMSTKFRQINQIMDRYEFLNYDQLVLTKLDECEKNENILNMFYQYSYPIAYLCSGQEVPNDIEKPTNERILKLILGDEYDA